MTVPAPLVRDAFHFFLGRPPRSDNPPQFETVGELTHALANSPEFRNSPRARKSSIEWPLSQVFVSKKNKVLYCPIGKNACTFMKRHMVQISDIPFTNYILPDIHSLTDHVRTGAQLSDYEEEDVAQILQDPDYFKFAILRDPAQRLLSAYVEKFVMHRMNAANQHHTGPVVWAVQQHHGFAAPDFDHGITFREFIAHVVAQPPLRLDAHWRPQYTYLEGIEWHWLCPVERINDLLETLETRSGMSLSRQPYNETNSGKGDFYEGAADLLPADLLAQPRCSQESFFDEPLLAAVNSYFRRDQELLQKANNQGPP